jgi:hypothetical protein
LKDWESAEWAESPSKILDKWLSKSLMKCDEAVLDTLVKEVESLLASNPNVEWLSDLSDLLKEVKENREKWNEDSFNKFKDIINKGKLSDLNSLKNDSIFRFSTSYCGLNTVYDSPFALFKVFIPLNYLIIILNYLYNKI